MSDCGWNLEELKLMMLDRGRNVDFIPSSNCSRRSSFFLLATHVGVRGEFQRLTIQIRDKVAMLYISTWV